MKNVENRIEKDIEYTKVHIKSTEQYIIDLTERFRRCSNSNYENCDKCSFDDDEHCSAEIQASNKYDLLKTQKFNIKYVLSLYEKLEYLSNIKHGDDD